MIEGRNGVGVEPWARILLSQKLDWLRNDCPAETYSSLKIV